MKKTSTLLLIITTISTINSFSQNLTFTDVIPEIREKFVTYHGNTILYYNHYSDFTNSLNKLEYLSANASAPAEKVVKYTPKIDVDGFNRGVVAKIFVNQEGFLFEVHILYNMSGTSSVLIVKRELEGFKEIKRLLLSEADVKFCANNNETIFIIGQTNYYQLDFDLNIGMSKPFDIFSNTEVNIKADTAKLDEQSNIIMPLFISNPEKFSLFGRTTKPKSALFLAIFDNEGEISVISPELPGTIYHRYSRFNYDSKKNELSGLFITNDPTEKGEFIGKGFKYLYLRWNKEGEILDNGEHKFSFAEFKNKELIEYSNLVKFNPDDFEFKFVDYSTPGNIEFLDDGSALYITDLLNGLPGKIFNSKLLFMVSPKGELLWNRILPFSNSEIYKKTSYIIKDDKLHYLIFDYSANYTGDQYVPKITSGKFTGLLSSLTERIIDLKTGEILSNKILTHTKSDDFTPYKFVLKDLNNLIFKYSYTQRNNEQYLKIEY
jgi:hypothetical protein